jgi:predicted DNA-binding protein (MmcQ/YjbR family)
VNPEDCFRKISAYCLSKPEAFEDHPWGDTVFKVGSKGKIFCFCGTETPVISVKSTLEKQAALIQHPDIGIAAYVGRYGWVTVQMRDEATFQLAFELIDESYDLVNPRPRKGRRDGLG